MHGRPKNDVENGQKWLHQKWPRECLGQQLPSIFPLQNKHFNFSSLRQLINLPGHSGIGLTAKVLGRVSLVALLSDPARSALRPKSA
jgi:hypothetical protein